MIEGQQRVCFDTFLLVFLLGRFPCNRYDSVLLFKEKSHQLQYWRKLFMHTAKIARTATVGQSVRALQSD